VLSSADARAAGSAAASSQQAARLPLGWRAVTADTLARYRVAVEDFLTWTSNTGAAADNEHELDDLVVRYVQRLHDDGYGRTAAEAAVYGMVFFLPGLKGRLPRCQQALRGWVRVTPAVSHPPMSWELACAVAAVMAAKREHARHAVGVLLSFDCFLRVSELCALLPADVADDGDKRMGALHRGCLLRIGRAKTGTNQTVRVHDPAVRELLMTLVRATPSAHRLFPFTPRDMRAVFHAACASLGLSMRYVPHSLRHGGATHWHNNLGRSMEDIMHRGRWVSSKVARLYVQQGPAVWMSMKVPDAAYALGLLVSRDVARHVGALTQGHYVGAGMPRPAAVRRVSTARSGRLSS
jgi:hypothetical protein